MKKCLTLLLLSLPFYGLLQSVNYDKQWTFLGPDEKPLEDGHRTATGIGPIEFITANKQVEGLLLAAALNGGLFYSKNGGDQWFNAGSDQWPYSACAWAMFHPKHSDTWFAYSNQHGANGSAGPIGEHGGIYRTIDAGLNWELVADKSSFINSEYLTVYGFKFHPTNPDMLFVYTTEGIYKTNNCLQEEVKWERVTALGGWIFDLEFVADNMVMTQMQHGKWNVFYKSLSNGKPKKIDFISELNVPIETITIEPYQDQILLLINYLKKPDEVWKFDLGNGQKEKILDRQRVIFGTGRTFAVSPFKDELIIGNSTTIKKYNISEKAMLNLRGGYHVDIERVEYDPFDSSKIYLGTHGGVYVTNDNGNSWISKSKGLGVAEVQGIAVDDVNIERVAIGCYHDGSSLRDDFNHTGKYEWKNVNGGDGLIPLLVSGVPNVVYSSNQYNGGGLYLSLDSGRTRNNVHQAQGVQTAGWSMAAVLHPINESYLFFNFNQPSGESKGNADIARTTQPLERGSAQKISNFYTSHGIEKYAVYGIYNSKSYPNTLFAHVLDIQKNDQGRQIFIHRLFRTDNCLDTSSSIINSWYEIEIPRSDWVSDVKVDANKRNIIYLSYSNANPNHYKEGEDKGMVYRLKYNKRNNMLSSITDITSNIPLSVTGRYNLAADEHEGFYFGTRTGVYYGDKKVLKGRGDWISVGHGLPHCKLNGLHYDKKRRTLTVGFFGRGVWRYYL